MIAIQKKKMRRFTDHDRILRLAVYRIDFIDHDIPHMLAMMNDAE